MKKQILKFIVLPVCASSLVYASGYKVPEQSLNSVALSAAYVANANGADASYYNPANMVWNDDANQIEGAFTYIYLSRVHFKGQVYSNATHTFVPTEDNSRKEQFLVPTIHFSSKDQGGWRYGLSITAPGGLSKRWDGTMTKATAKEFTLKVIELNPTFAYKVNDKFAIGGGLRLLYSDGKVKADGGSLYSEDMTGDTYDFGYNLALSYRPNDALKFATTYRSKIDMTVKGSASGYVNKYLITGNPADLTTHIQFDSSANVKLPLPATLNVAASYTFKQKTTLELVYERVYWSKYKQLDFNFDDPVAEGVLGNPKEKSWEDTNTFRIGVTHQYSDALKLMAGFAIDKTPIPSRTIGFELPDSDAKLYSFGFEYKYNKNLTFGLSYLYDKKKNRTISSNDNNINGIVGTFSNSTAQLLTVGVKYKF